jgi:hypothetical protein
MFKSIKYAACTEFDNSLCYAWRENALMESRVVGCVIGRHDTENWNVHAYFSESVPYGIVKHLAAC